MIFSYSKKRLLFIFSLLVLSNCIFAQNKTEGDLVNAIVKSLQTQDSSAYAHLFLSADSIATITIRKAPANNIESQRAKMMLETSTLLMYQDSMLNVQAFTLFNPLVKKGEQSGIHWAQSLLSRYELEVLPKTRNEVYEAIAPDRFVGYVFLEDMLTRKIYGLTLSDIMKIDGKWYGGELNYIYEASNKDEFNAQLKAEKIRLNKRIPEDTTNKKEELHVSSQENDADNEINPKKRKQVSDRKLYTGKLDNEIPVTLYIRYILGDCPEKICSWEALFKFGDQDEYSKQAVTRNADGKWIFTEDETGAVMELELKNGEFHGVFTATSDKVDYEASLKETPMTQRKLEALDAIIEKDLTR
jgi:hypothetical protein